MPIYFRQLAIYGYAREWHAAAGIANGGDVDLAGSCYLVLSWNADGWYQLHQFPLTLPPPESLNWYFPFYTRKGERQIGNHLNGDDAAGRVFEWYGQSGGQLKYYPLADTAAWDSARFRLEPLPDNLPHSILAKAQSYFPQLWPPGDG